MVAGLVHMIYTGTKQSLSSHCLPPPNRFFVAKDLQQSLASRVLQCNMSWYASFGQDCTRNTVKKQPPRASHLRPPHRLVSLSAPPHTSLANRRSPCNTTTHTALLRLRVWCLAQQQHGMHGLFSSANKKKTIPHHPESCLLFLFSTTLV